MDVKLPFDRVAKQEKARKNAEENRKNWELYQQDNQRIAENTARLRALRLAKEAADAAAAAAQAERRPVPNTKVAVKAKVAVAPKRQVAAAPKRKVATAAKAKAPAAKASAPKKRARG
jgi:hypothetical protein